MKYWRKPSRCRQKAPSAFRRKSANSNFATYASRNCREVMVWINVVVSLRATSPHANRAEYTHNTRSLGLFSIGKGEMTMTGRFAWVLAGAMAFGWCAIGQPPEPGKTAADVIPHGQEQMP